MGNMNWKKWRVLLLTAGLAAGAAACGGKTEGEEPAEAVEQEAPEETPAEAEPEEEPKEEAGEARTEDAGMDSEASAEGGAADNENRKDQYMSVLLAICTENRLPDGSAPGAPDGGSGKMSDNQFAVCDIDGDGSRELIIQYVTAPTAGMRAFIYDYDPETKSVREEFQEYPLLTFYDNGIIEAGWSHNQGMAGDALWPYTLWQYDREEDAWHVAAEVDAWSRAVSETDRSTDAPFPQEVDADGDGVVYYIRPEGLQEDIAPVDGAEYRQWRDSYIGGAKEIDVVYEAMTEQNIYMLE